MGDIFHHVRDANSFELPGFNHWPKHGLPQFNIPGYGDFQVTKFMLLQVLAGLIVLLIFRGLAKRAQSGEAIRGRFWNFWEFLALFVRDEVVRPAIGDGSHDDHGHGDHGHEESHGDHSALADTGSHPADRYVPFIWSCFFYILICNLLGAIPFLGSATGSISVTLALAICAFAYVVRCGSEQMGFAGFWLAQCPHLDIPPFMKIGLVPLIWSIEVLGMFIKHGVLAIRLFANMMGGHTVLGTLLAFIAVAADSSTGIYALVSVSSVLGQVAVGMLELLVAFIQAYIFAFLTSLFVGMALHPH
ncbi:MAG: ATP synthase F0 subunit A [Planctomycetaceae bacterium]|nr:ATP synthase F0 subunit A [Planctomycetaceae bacterium]